MDRQSAQTLIQKTFEQSFEKDRYFYFLKNMLNHVEEDSPTIYRGSHLPDSYKPSIESLERLGKYNDEEDHEIDLLVVQLKKETSLVQARTLQRNFASWHLKGGTGGNLKDAALTAYVSPSQKDWRFSFVKMDYKLVESRNGRVRAKEEFTPARRYSFLVGENENSHTAKSQLLPLLENDEKNPTLGEIEDKFNIETVTKEFFGKYRDLFLRVTESLDKIVKSDARIKEDFSKKNVSTVDFSKKLLGQIVFLYFLQKKGWFGVERDANWGTGSKRFIRNLFDQKNTKYKNFFNDILEPMFYEALASDRTGDFYAYLNCKIPFLNGGLFDPIGDYDWVHTDILLPNELFSNKTQTAQGDIGTGILDIFDRYNFTVKEDEPMEKEVAVDPEMLGKVFENLLEVKDRRSKGTFYTPREIVHYMCQESLVNYLVTGLKGKVGREDIETLIQFGETVVEHDSRVVKFGKETERYSYKLPKKVIQNASALDKALASIRICDPAVGSGAFLVGMMSEIVRVRNALTNYFQTNTQRSPYAFKRQAINECLCGADIDSGAVEICMLRLWLSLVVDEEDIKQIKPLPNLDYKIVTTNSLLKGEQVDWLKKEAFEELEILKVKVFDETNKKKKQEIRKQIKELIFQVQDKNHGVDLEVYFSEIFNQLKGFDVVIGNPPYVQKKLDRTLKNYLQQTYHHGNTDLYTWFIERGIGLLKEKGVFTFITPNKWMRANYGKGLRNFLVKKTFLRQIVDFGELPVFENAATFPSILVTQKEPKKEQNLIYAPIKRLDFTSLKEEVSSVGMSLDNRSMNGENWTLAKEEEVNIIEKMKRKGIPFGDYVQGKLFRGVLTGLNKAFVIDRQMRDRFITEDPKSAELIKPFIAGNDVRKYRIHFKEKYLILIPKGWTNTKKGQNKNAWNWFAKNYPAVSKYLLPYEGEGSKRQDKGDYWWELRACGYYSEFKKPKIIFPDIAKESRMAFDEKNIFIGNTGYIIPINDLYLLGVLNSKLIFTYYKRTAMVLGDADKGGRLRWIYQHVVGIPIPFIDNLNPKDKSLKKKIEKSVQNILNLNQDLEEVEIDRDKENLKMEIEKVDEQINRLVYELYSLTQEEIKIVENEA
jgi:hypothetical protein